MRGIVRGALTGSEDQVVSGALALVEKFAPGEPRQRIPPIEIQCEASKQVRRDVTAADMRQLVEQNHPSPLFRPFGDVGWDEDRWPQEPECERHAAARRYADFHVVIN